MLYDCWKMCVMMGAICSAVSLRTLAGSSSGPIALFWLRFSNCLIIPFVPISRGGMLEYNEGSITITGMGYLSLVNTEVVVEGICLIAVVCYWFIIYSQGGNDNVFLFVCNDE